MYQMGVKLVLIVGFVGHLLACMWMLVTVVSESAVLSDIVSLNWWTFYGLQGESAATLYINSFYVRAALLFDSCDSRSVNSSFLHDSSNNSMRYRRVPKFSPYGSVCCACAEVF
jgi:hypothetical protein